MCNLYANCSSIKLCKNENSRWEHTPEMCLPPACLVPHHHAVAAHAEKAEILREAHGAMVPELLLVFL